MALTNSQSVFEPLKEASSGASSAVVITKDAQISGLQSEIHDLKLKLQEEQEKADALAYDAPVVAGNVLETRHSFVLDEKTSGKYTLTVEAPVPMFGLAVQADVPIRLLEDEGTAIVSHSPPDIVGGSMCLATYRCQESVNRVEVHMEVVEGQYGTIQAFVIPAAPPKQVTIVTCKLKPLCLHCRVDHAPSSSTPLNELKVTGNFQKSEIHSWIQAAIPEVSEDGTKLSISRSVVGIVCYCALCSVLCR